MKKPTGQRAHELRAIASGLESLRGNSAALARVRAYIATARAEDVSEWETVS